MKSQRLPVSGVYHASASRMLSAGIHRRSPGQGVLTSEPDSADQQNGGGDPEPQSDHQSPEHRRHVKSQAAASSKSGRHPDIDVKNVKTNVAASDDGPEDHPFIDFIASIMPSGEVPNDDPEFPIYADDSQASGYRPENQGRRILRNAPETKPVSSVHTLAIRRRGMERWLPNIGSFLITGIVIVAVIWMTVIELSVILGR